MAHRRGKPQPKTFQQRQTERHLRDQHSRTFVEDMARTFSCSRSIAYDFAGQCEDRTVALKFDLLCSKLALDFWADPPEAARPVVDLLRELEAERRRHMAALTQLGQQLLESTKNEATHQHLTLPIGHYQQQIRDQMFPDLELRSVPHPADPGAPDEH
jgi:hypothetical protein